MTKAEGIWVFSAMAVSIASAWAALPEYPGPWKMGGVVIAALAQGGLIWRAFVQAPPAPPPNSDT